MSRPEQRRVERTRVAVGVSVLLLVALASLGTGCHAARPAYSSFGDDEPAARSDPYTRQVARVRLEVKTRKFATAVASFERLHRLTERGLVAPEGAPALLEVRAELFDAVARQGANDWGAIFDHGLLRTETKLALLDAIGRVRIFGGEADPGMNPPGTLPTRRVALKEHPVELELAVDPESRGYGFMARTSIPDGQGMLFLFPFPGPRAFWAKHCYVPIDLAFVHEEGDVYTITDLHTLTPEPNPRPDDEYPRYPASKPVRIAIEMRGGWFAEHGFEVGDTLDLGPAIRDLEAR